MPKRIRQTPDSTDAIPPQPEGFRTYMKALGKKGGTISGARRMTNLTAKQRTTLARKAAKARWKRNKDNEPA